MDDPRPDLRAHRDDDLRGGRRGSSAARSAPLAEGEDADWADRRGEGSPRWGTETEERTWTPG